MASSWASNFRASRGNVFLAWVIHALSDVLVELTIREPLNLLVAVEVLLLGATDDFSGDADGDFSDAVEVGVEPRLSMFLLVESLGETLGGSVNHLLRDVDSLAEKSTETDTWEDVHVISLSGMINSTVGTSVIREWRSRSKDNLLVGPLHSLVKSALGLVNWVGQWEDDWARSNRGHLANDGLGEHTSGGAETHEGSWLNIVDNLLKRGELLTIVVWTRKVELVVSQLVSSVVSDETLGVDEPELAASLLLWDTRLDEKLDNLLGDTDGGGSSSHKHELVLLEWNARLLKSVHDTSENDGSSSLDIIVEASVSVAITLEGWEWVLEILKLDNDSWPLVVEGNHHLVEELEHLWWANTAHLGTEIERILEILLVVGSQVKGDWKGTLGVDTGATSVESKLANRNAHSVDSQISETEDTRTISDDGNIDLVLSPIIKHLTQLTAIGP